MGLSLKTTRILERLHNAIQKEGQRSLDEIRTRLHDLAQDGKLRATEKDFIAVTTRDGVLSVDEAGALFLDLTGGGESMSFAEIVRALRPPTSRQRAVLTRAVFDMIDQDRDGLLSRDEVLASYRAASHPDVRCGLRPSAEVQQDFTQTLWNAATMSGSNHGDMLTFPTFLDFYSSLTAFTSEDHFREAISSVWVSPVAMSNDQASAVHMLGGAGGLAANLRAQILYRGIAGISAFREGVRTAARPGSKGEIDQEAFCASAHRAGVQLKAREMAQVFRYLDRRGTATIPAADALRAVRGELNERRKDQIEASFNSLLSEAGVLADCDNENDALDTTSLTRHFRAVHQRVLSEKSSHQAILAELVEVLEGTRATGDKVTRAEWREYHWDMSALVEDDDAFCGYLKRVWGPGTRQSTDAQNAESLDASALAYRDRTLPVSMSHPTDVNCFGRPKSAGFAGNFDDLAPDYRDPRESRRENRRQDPESSHPPREAWIFPQMGEPGQDAVERPQTSFRGAKHCPSISPGISAILDRARNNLAAGGIPRASLLLKAFRKEDRKGHGKVTLSGFKTVVGGARLGLREAEIRILFEHFDNTADGEISYERFLAKMREPLPPHRLALVHQAFDRMDADGDDWVFVDDIVGIFNAREHPHVLEGSREEDDVRREFLESFAVTDGARRRCTREDFIRWMELISLSFPGPAADDTFERLVKGCWGIPETAAGVNDGNVAAGLAFRASKGCRRLDPVRVVVTRADGSISVEEICSLDVGVSGGLKDGGHNGLLSQKHAEVIRQDLAARGIHAVHVHLLSEGNGSSGTPVNDGTMQRQNVQVDTTEAPVYSADATRNAFSLHDVRIAKLGPAGDGSTNGRFGGQEGGEAVLGLDRGLLSVLDAARERLASRGHAGFLTLSRRLRLAGFFRSPAHLPARPSTAPATRANNTGDSGGDGPFVSLGSFKEVLSGISCGLNSRDLTRVFMHLDLEGRGEIPVDVALKAIRGRLSGVRLALVRAAFSRLLRSGNNLGNATTVATVDAVLANFNPRGHPEVIAERRSAENVRKDFMDAVTTTKGVVTWKDFENYYTDVSAATSANPCFILQVRGCWGLGAIAAAKVVCAAAAAAAPPVWARDKIARLSGDYDAFTSRRKYTKAQTSAPPGVLPGTTHRGNITIKSGRKQDQQRVPTAGIAALLRKLGMEIKGQGASWGLAGLRRALFHADGNKDGFMSLGEFKAALAPLQTRMSPSEIRALFAHLEAEAYICIREGVGSTTGVISCQALLDAIRAPLSGDRLGIVRLAFRRMDINGEGRLSPETLAQRFDASRHPAVIKGHATVEEVQQELLDTFVSTGADDGKGGGPAISEEDFVEHYSDVSFSVPSDAEFRQLVMNCWGLDGCSDNIPVRTSRNDIANKKNDSQQARPVPTRHFAVTCADGSYATKELFFPSERREDDEDPLTEAEERALKNTLFEHDKLYATEIYLLPKDFQHKYRSSDSAHSGRLSAKDLLVDRRQAWAWAPMSLSEICAVADTAAAVGTSSSNTLPCERRQDVQGRDKNNDRSASFSPGIPNKGNNGAETYERARSVVQESADDERASEEGCEFDGGNIVRRVESGARPSRRWKTDTERNREPDLSVRYLMTKIRSEMKARKMAGMASLCRHLWEAATAVIFAGERAEVVKEVDFRRALRAASLPLTESDIRRIFSHFEVERLGVMDPKAFVDCLNGRMSERRSALVLEVFDTLDATGKGHLMLDQVLDAFHATRHPEVVSGDRSPDVVFSEFVGDFVAGIPTDKGETESTLRIPVEVTREDFFRYYEMISSTIPDDGYFELLLRTCWRMSSPDGIRKTTVDHGSTGHPVNSRDACGGGIIDIFGGEPLGRHKGKTGCHHSSREVPNCGETGSGCHCRTASKTLPSNRTREPSSTNMPEIHAAGSDPGGSPKPGPSEGSRKLRAEHLARTFHSQITFGVEQDTRDVQRPSRNGKSVDLFPLAEDGTTLAAGGGRGRRVAEGAAWTSGGRRLVPDSKVFMSHLGMGLRVTRDEACRLVDCSSPFGGTRPGDPNVAPLDGDARRWTSAERKSRAAAASRELPVWMPCHDRLESRQPAGASETLTDTENNRRLDRLLPDATVSTGVKNEASHSTANESTSNVPELRMSTRHVVASSTHKTSEDCARKEALPREVYEGECNPSAFSSCVRPAKSERKGLLNRRGCGFLSGSGDVTQRDRRRGMAAKSDNVVSDTYRSSLVLG